MEIEFQGLAIRQTQLIRGQSGEKESDRMEVAVLVSTAVGVVSIDT